MFVGARLHDMKYIEEVKGQGLLPAYISPI